MPHLIRNSLVLLGLMTVAASSYGQVYRSDQIEVELIAETRNVVPGETLWLAIRLKPIEHWHTYWKFGGDSGEATEATITLTVRPKSARDASEYEDERLGLTVREITVDVRIRLNLAEGVQGVIVRRVPSGSPANQAQLRAGMVILRVGGESFANLEEFEAISHRLAEEKPAEITLFCRVGANTAFFRIQPRWDD